MKKICVFCGSSRGNNKIYSESARKLGDIIVKNNLSLIYGGAKIGLMGELANRVMELKGEVIGIMPYFLVKMEVAHTGITRLVKVNSMHERKQIMLREAEGFIAMPGGSGTMDEIFEMITMGQLNQHKKPCAFLNINGYYDYIDKFLQNAVAEGFLDKGYRDMIIIENEPEIIIERFMNYSHPDIDKAKIALKEYAY